jgi:hypothetical protein
MTIPRPAAEGGVLMNRLRLLVAFVVVLACTSGASAAIIHFTAFLDGAQETPPVATPATGTGKLTLDDSTGAYSITGTFANLIGTSNNAHIHGPAAVGVGPAGVVFGLTFDFGVTSGNYSGAGVMTALQMTELKSDLYYVNIHSTFRPGGEIRGQLLIPEPGTFVLLGLGGVALAAMAWRRRRAANA